LIACPNKTPGTRQQARRLNNNPCWLGLCDDVGSDKDFYCEGKHACPKGNNPAVLVCV